MEEIVMNEIYDTSVSEEIGTPTVQEEQPAPESTDEIVGIVDGCDHLYIRSSASTEASNLGIVAKGEKLQIKLEESVEDWYRIRTVGGLVGFCMKNYVIIDH